MKFLVFFMDLAKSACFKYILLLLFFFFMAAAIRLLKNNRRLKEENKSLVLQCQKSEEKNKSLLLRCQKLEAELNYKKQKSQEYRDRQEAEEAEKADFEEHSAEYCSLKDSCMNRNESRFFYYINNALKKIFRGPEREDFIVFPQVSIHAFINMPDDNRKSLLLSKNIDYLVCQRFQKVKTGKNNKPYKSYFYRPRIAIELDGPSHWQPIYGEEALQKQKEDDALKDNLFNGLGIPFIRHRLTDGRIRKSDEAAIKEKLQEAVKSIANR